MNSYPSVSPFRLEFLLHLLITGGLLLTGLLAARQVQSLPLNTSRYSVDQTPVFDLPEVIVRPTHRR
ncbi:hypothetical protein [Gloeobacter kilaueensis]|uniref:Uncharacterized protein n=1 Tax=Gloeobacter kilaueensis (strain ATCC BAA-2537 / CCAP 1431/1 / ULC 316 / JS1) TaxID=1183438 RepID=U5QI13_GLOK1|nr:hypothetical protein [Gloeobacter kilaueensis]AGY58617.1 hypothetical protein GKIL_2371 [Gloeobacter kilaueensis JS1]